MKNLYIIISLWMKQNSLPDLVETFCIWSQSVSTEMRTNVAEDSVMSNNFIYTCIY